MSENGTNNKSAAMLIGSMVIFGTIGLFRRYIPVSSAMLACIRGALGGIFLLVFSTLAKKQGIKGITKKHFFLLALTGVLLGSNWILLFEAYNYTSIAVATLCYYMQPAIVILLSPLILKEKLTVRKIICVVISVAGIALVSGVNTQSGVGAGDVKGIVMGLLAAALYASVVIMNKINPVEAAYGKTIVQLFSAAILLIPYLLLTEGISFSGLDVNAVIMIIIVGIVHTGIAYALYFGSMNGLSSQSVAILSYIDPVLAIIISAIFLQEAMTVYSVIGAVMVMGAAYFSM